jgi:hypothetical protein
MKKEWFKDKYNITFLAILIIAFAIRLYYFFLTKNQPLWWDEAEYALRAKAFAFHTPLTGFAPERELIVPLLFSLILKLGLGELGMRVIQLLVSTLTIFMTYIVFSKIMNKKIGLVASFGMTFFWLHLFFSGRILLYLWAPLIYLSIVYFFYTGFINGNKKHLIIFAVLSSLGLQIYFSTGFLLLGLLIYLLITEGFSLFKKKKTWIVLGVFFLVLAPYAIYSQITYGFPIPRMAVGFKAVTQESGAGLAGMFSYINMFPTRVGWIFTILSFLGVLYFLSELALGLGIKGTINKHKNTLLIFTCFFAPLLAYTLYGVIGGSGTFYDAFVMPVFTFAFAFAGLMIEKIYNFGKKYNKYLTLIFILILLILHAYSGLKSADSNIKAKLTSYDTVKTAGLWLKDNTSSGDIIVSRSLPQNTYYSERATYDYPSNESLFTQFIKEKKPKFVVDSIWENTQPWIHQYVSEHNETLIPTMAYYSQIQGQKALTLVVYRVKE